MNVPWAPEPAAAQYAQTVGLTYPVRMDALVRSVGSSCRVVFDKELLEDGRCDRVGDEWRISLATDVPRTRQTFTLAHEIGHLVLGQSKASRRNEEVWCNGFAAALLMPRARVTEMCSDTRDDLEVLSDLAKCSGVSLAAALVRTYRVCGWKSALLTFHHVPVRRRWILAGATGLPKSVRYRVEMADPNAYPPSSKEREFGSVRVRVGQSTHEVPAQTIGSGSRRFALLAASALSTFDSH